MLIIVGINIVIHLFFNYIASEQGIDIEVSFRKAGKEARILSFEQNHLLHFYRTGSHGLLLLRFDIFALVALVALTILKEIWNELALEWFPGFSLRFSVRLFIIDFFSRWRGLSLSGLRLLVISVYWDVFSGI